MVGRILADHWPGISGEPNHRLAVVDQNCLHPWHPSHPGVQGRKISTLHSLLYCHCPDVSPGTIALHPLHLRALLVSSFLLFSPLTQQLGMVLKSWQGCRSVSGRCHLASDGLALLVGCNPPADQVPVSRLPAAPRDCGDRPGTKRKTG